MSNHDTPSNQLDRPFERIRTTSRQGSAFAQALPQGVAGLYLVAQIDDQGVHIEARERFTSGPGRLRNKRHARITLTASEAGQLAAILQGQVRDGDQPDPLEQALDARVADAEFRANRAIGAKLDADKRFREIQRVAKKRFQMVKWMRHQLINSELCAQAAEEKIFNVEQLKKQITGARSKIERLSRRLKTRIGAITPAIIQPVTYHQTPASHAQETSDNSAVNSCALSRNHDEDAGEIFLEWLIHSISHGSEYINTPGACIHVLPDGLALVTPKIFRRFDAENWRYVQKRFRKLDWCQKTPRGTHAWVCLFTRPHGKKVRVIHVALIPNPESALGITLPAPNPNLMLLAQKESSTWL